MSAKLSKARELRGLPPGDLKEQIEQLRQELWQQRLKAREGGLQQTHVIGKSRRQIARVQTVLSEQRRTDNAKKGS